MKDYLKLLAFIVACIGLPLLLFVGIPLWQKSQAAVPECTPGKPTPARGCTVTIKPYEPRK